MTTRTPPNEKNILLEYQRTRGCDTPCVLRAVRSDEDFDKGTNTRHCAITCKKSDGSPMVLTKDCGTEKAGKARHVSEIKSERSRIYASIFGTSADFSDDKKKKHNQTNKQSNTENIHQREILWKLSNLGFDKPPVQSANGQEANVGHDQMGSCLTSRKTSAEHGLMTITLTCLTSAAASENVETVFRDACVL